MRFRAALVVLTLAAFALRVHDLGRQSFWLDEVDAIALAGEPVAAQVRKLATIGENGPLYFLLFKGWITVAGTSEFGGRYLSALASTAAVPLLGAVGYWLAGSASAAITAALLAAVSPYYVWYGQDAKMYPLFALLAMGAQYCFLRGWSERAGRSWTWWAGYVIASSLALYVHLFAALQIAANTVAGVALWGRRPCGRRGFAAATAFLIAPYVPLAIWQWPLLVRGADVGYRATGLRDIVVALLEQLTWHLNPPTDRRLLLPLIAVLGYGAYRLAAGTLHPPQASRPRSSLITHHSSLITLALWLSVPILLTAAAQSRVPVFRDRYLIPLLAPLLLLCAAAIAPPWNRAGTATPLAPAAAAFLALGFAYALAHRPPNPNFRAAAELVRSLATPDDQVGFLAQYAERPFEFYFRKGSGRYVKVTLPYTNYPGLDERTGLLNVAASLRGGRWLWVVRFEDWIWDSRGLAGRYLQDRGARVVLSRDFDGVSVTRYEMPA